MNAGRVRPAAGCSDRVSPNARAGCHQLPGLGVRHRVHALEALHEVATAHPPVGLVHRCRQFARAGLFRDDLALGVRLVVEHVGMSAFLAEVLRERIACPELAQARILLETRLRDDVRGSASLGVRGIASLPP